MIPGGASLWHWRTWTNSCRPPGGGALPLWRWRGCKADVGLLAQRPPIFSTDCCHPMTIYLLIVFAVTQRPHIIWRNVGSSIALTQRPPPPIRQIIFAIFDDYFANSCFWRLLTQWPLIFGNCSHWMPQPLEVGLCLHPYPFDIGVPPPR